MARYFKYFKIPFIIFAIVVIGCIAIRISAGNKAPVVRGNKVTDLTQNVFDYAGNLTEEHIAELESYITEIEDQTKIDIAIVTLNESLEGKGYYGGSNHMWVNGYADTFADVHQMGYEMPMGSNVVFVDNCYREPSTGRVDSWMSTYGTAKTRISEGDCESLMDDALYGLNDGSTEYDYYRAYRRVVELIPRYASATGGILGFLRPIYIFAFSLVVAAIYVAASWRSKAGDKTTSGSTYLESGRPNMRRRTDVFLRKTVTKVKIQSSSGSGGGGGHGGGGHSR